MGPVLDQFRPSLMFRWDIGTLAWVVWDGSLTTGALTIGTVNQGTGGASPWLVKSGLGIVAHDYVSLSSGATQDVYTFKSGGSGGSTIATVTINYTDATKATITDVTKT